MPKKTLKRTDFYYWQHKDTGEVRCLKAGEPHPSKVDWVCVTKSEYDHWMLERVQRLTTKGARDG